MSDMSSHDALQHDELHTMTLNQLVASVAAAGIVMSRRQIMRHCKAGTFDAQKLPATNNVEEWFIAPASVEKGIADIKTLQALRSRRDATGPARSESIILDKSNHDMPGHDATRQAMSQSERQDDRGETEPATSRYVALLEHDNEFLREQVKKKDEQITDLSKRFGETQTLLGAMQRMLAPLLGQADPFNKPPESREVTDAPN